MEEEKEPSSNQKKISLENVRAIKVVGKGAMGTVFLAHDPTSGGTGSPFALKVVDLAAAAKPDAARRARWEISVLSRLRHPCLPSLLASTSDQQNDDKSLIAWALPFCPGGDLNNLRHRQHDRVFSSAAIKFYLAEIISALHHLHSLGIAYRDLKPENILLQSSGHLTLTDFDLSRALLRRTSPPSDDLPAEIPRPPRRRRRWIFAEKPNPNPNLKKTKSARVSPVSRRKPSFSDGERSKSFVGTEEYVSPEVVRGEGHEFAVDWWALGVLAYEMLYGTTPFKGKNRKETFRNVLFKQPEFPGKPDALSDLIGRLLEKDPTRRLGYARGADEIRSHEFFRGLRWDLLGEVLRPPFIPARDDDGDLTATPLAGFDVREYFQNLRSPPSLPPSPDRQRLTEF